MSIKSPDWAIKAGAYPTKEGWAVARPKGREEIIRSANFSAAEIAEWYGQGSAPQMLHESPVSFEPVAVTADDIQSYSLDETSSNKIEDGGWPDDVVAEEERFSLKSFFTKDDGDI